MFFAMEQTFGFIWIRAKFHSFQHFDSYFSHYRNDLSINHLEDVRLNIFSKEFLKIEI